MKIILITVSLGLVACSPPPSVCVVQKAGLMKDGTPYFMEPEPRLFQSCSTDLKTVEGGVIPSTPLVPVPEEPVASNNGWGNGDQAAPGKSLERNSAENGGGSQRNHGNSNKN